MFPASDYRIHLTPPQFVRLWIRLFDMRSFVFNKLTALFLHFSLQGARGPPARATAAVPFLGMGEDTSPSALSNMRSFFFNKLTALFLHFSLQRVRGPARSNDFLHSSSRARRARPAATTVAGPFLGMGEGASAFALPTCDLLFSTS